MALGINLESGTGSGLPYLKYDAKAGRWFRRKNIEKGEEQDVDITDGFSAMFDLADIQVGWMMFAAGGPPSFVTVPVGHKFPPRPEGKDWKQGFRMHAELPQSLGGGVYEVASSARAFLSKIDALHDLYEADEKSRGGLLPIVTMSGVEMIETPSPKGMNRNYAPRLFISKWQKPPPELIAARKPLAKGKSDFPDDDAAGHDLNDEVPF